MNQNYKTNRIIYFLCFMGLLMHLKTALIEIAPPIDEFTIGLFFGSILPYILIILFRKKLNGSFYAVITVFSFDLLLHLDSFSFSTSSTGSIGLLFIPFFNIFVLIPLSFLADNLIKKYRAS